MQKSCKSLVLNLVAFVVLALGLGTQARADKTLMFLMDEYLANNTDSVASTPVVTIPHNTGNNGYFNGLTDQVLTQTQAYSVPIPVHPTEPANLPYPRELPRWWYSLPNFNSSHYREGKIRLYMTYMMAYHRWNAGPGTMQIDMQSNQNNSSTNELNSPTTREINKCIDTLHGDSVWFRYEPGNVPADLSNNAPTANLRCYDHNPFFTKVGTVHLLNPWPGKTPYVQVGNLWFPLYQEVGRPGWMVTTLWADPRVATPFKIRLANGNPATGAVQYMDAGGLGGNANGTFFDFTVTPGNGGEVWISPPATGIPPVVKTTAPPVSLTLYIEKPTWSASSVRVIWQGNDAKFVAAATKYCNWFQINFYQGAIPANILISNAIGDTVYGSNGKVKSPSPLSSSTEWISLAAQTAIGGVFSLNTDAHPLFLAGVPTTGGVCDTKVLAFSAYDYSYGKARTDPVFYEPFGELGPDDNCGGSGGGATAGLVLNALSANGRPVMNTAHASACDINTAVPMDAPQYWFDSLWKAGGAVTNVKSAGATPLNAFHCIHMPLKLDLAGQYYTYDNQSFFPFDTVPSIPTDFRPANGADFHFAMHAKAAFEYVPGLQFQFAGDDDVWIFIDKQLRLDLGGQHGAVGGSINVDNLGLVEGKSYQFDMFYTERHGVGSDINIKTTMNLVPTIDVNFDTTSAISSTGNRQVVDSWVTETTADASRCPEEGASSVVNKRRGNPVYTLVFPNGTELQIDSIYVATNLPGTLISQNGSHFEIDTTVLQNSGKLTMSGLYQIRIDLATSTHTIPFSNISKTVDVKGQLFDSNGDGNPDSVVLSTANATPAFANVVSVSLHWADRAGVADSVLLPATSVTVQPGNAVLTGTFLLPSRTNCPPSGCKVQLGTVFTSTNGQAVANPIVELNDAMAPVADSAWLIYDTTGVPGAMDTLYVIASEPMQVFSGLLPSGDSAYVLAGNSTVPRPISGTAKLVGTLLKLPLDPSNNPIQPGDSIRLGGISGDVLGNAPGILSKWVHLKADPVAKAWMLDVNGDGYPDSIGIGVRGSLTSATSAVAHWKTVAGVDTVLNFATPTGIGTGLSLPGGILKNATFCTGCYMELAMGVQTKRISLLDSVPPVALDAKLLYGTMYDTLLLTVSESFQIGSAAGEGLVSLKSIGSLDRLGTLVTGTGTGTKVLQILVAPGAVAQDSVRLRGWIQDLNHKTVGVNSPFVPIQYGPQPIRVAIWDKNGDGLVDSVMYRLTRSAIGAPLVTGFGLKWGGTDVAVGALTRSADGLSWSGPVGPLPLLTAPFQGDQGWLVVGSDVTSYRTTVDDSVAPVAMSASLIFGLEATDSDTLKVKGSETMVFGGVGAFAMLGPDSGSATPLSLTNANSKLVTGTGDLVLAVSPGSIANNMAWVRLGSAVSDGNKAVGASSRWVKLVIKPSGRAYLFDSDGDGRADSMRVYVRGGLSSQQAILHWKTIAGKDTALTWNLGASVGPFGVHPLDSKKWFDRGATSCSNCTVTFLDDQGNPFVEWPLIDSVAPMALSGTYHFGLTQDTLVVKFSEPVVGGSKTAPWLEWGNAALGGTIVASDSSNALSATHTFYLTPANGAVEGWDSLRLAAGSNAGNVRDAGGKQVGLTTPWAPIAYGIPPFVAFLSDPLGLGQGTNVRVNLTRQVPKAAVSNINSFRFSWTNGAGTGLEDRTVLESSLVWDGVSSWTGVLTTPFAVGQTGCVGGCAAVATAKDASVRSTALQDSVPPTAIWAKFRYSLPDVAQDTLILGLSETWPGELPGNLLDPFALVGKSSAPINVSNMTNWILVDGKELRMVVPASFEKNVDKGDSTRLAYLAQGSRIWDGANNRVGVNSRWIPIVFGLRPPRLIVKPYKSLLVNSAKVGNTWKEPDPSVPQTELVWKLSKDSVFTTVGSIGSGNVGGAQPVNNIDQTIGIDILINRPLEGVLIIYDNLGTSVLSIDLNVLKEMWKYQPDMERIVRVMWNGTGKDHKFVASGIYLFRAVVKFDDDEGNKAFRNLVWKLGYRRDTK